jgi:hypothetical protein
MTMEQPESKIFDLKPKLTTAMKLAASFAITYYGLLLIYEVFTLVYSRYFIDSYYFNEGDTGEGTQELLIQIAQLALSVVLVFSLIQIFRKKVYGKALFVVFSILLIAFQFFTTGLVPLVKYALEVLLVLIIAPIRVKKKIKLKDGKLTVETVEETPDEESKKETAAIAEQPTEIQETTEETKELQEISEASSRPAEQP